MDMNEISLQLQAGKAKVVKNLVQQALDEGISAKIILEEGLLAGMAYKAIAAKNKYLGVAAAAIVCPVVNSGVFFLGCKLFFLDTIDGWAKAAGFTGDATTYVIVGLIGLNFVFEMLVNAVLSPVILRIINIRKAD